MLCTRELQNSIADSVHQVLCDQIGEFRLATWVGPMAATIAADQGDDYGARALAERGWARAQQLNQLLLSAWALNGLGYAAMQRGDLADSLAWYEQYVPLVRDTENGVARLWGTVQSASQREALVVAVRGVPGIQDVQSHLGRTIEG